IAHVWSGSVIASVLLFWVEALLGQLTTLAAAPLLLSPRRVEPARAIAGLLVLIVASALIALVSVGAI
ncbi:MAG: hypothetical protein ACO3VH_08740, partial [Ilumatobacteraceae bacterium]